MAEKNKTKKQSSGYKIQFKQAIIKKGVQKENPWNVARGERLNIVKIIEKTIPHYSYSDADSSIVTDEKICNFVTEKLSKTKNNVFDLTDFLYEMHMGDKLNKELVRLRDEIDIFSDEIKARYCKWKDLSASWLRKIIAHDLHLIENSMKLENYVQELKESVLSIKELRTKNEIIDYAPEKWSGFSEKVAEIKKQIHEMVRLFKERETICNIKAVSLEKTYQIIRDDLKDKFG